MNLNPLWIRHQGPNLTALARVALGALAGAPPAGPVPATPTPPQHASVPPRPDHLIDAYVQWCGADPTAYRNTVPPHLFPQWGFPLLSRTLAGVPVKLTAVLNQGCRLDVRGPIPRGVPLNLTATLEAINDDGNKVRLHQRLVTGTAAQPKLLVADVFAVVVKKRGAGGGSKTSEPDYRNVGAWSAKSRDGLAFALLTGDFNPIHWVAPYAKAAGFKNTILHGFGTLARTWEALARHAGGALPLCDVRFVRPLVLPARATVATADPDTQGNVPFRVVASDNLVAAGHYQQP